MQNNARCGHTHYDKGHCSQPDCWNDIRRCKDCSGQAFPPGAGRERGYDPFVEGPQS